MNISETEYTLSISELNIRNILILSIVLPAALALLTYYIYAGARREVITATSLFIVVSTWYLMGHLRNKVDISSGKISYEFGFKSNDQREFELSFKEVSQDQWQTIFKVEEHAFQFRRHLSSMEKNHLESQIQKHFKHEFKRSIER